MSEILLPVENGFWSREAIDEARRRQYERVQRSIEQSRMHFDWHTEYWQQEKERMKEKRAAWEQKPRWKRLLRWLLCPATIPRKAR